MRRIQTNQSPGWGLRARSALMLAFGLIVALLVMAACGDDDDGATSSATPDNTEDGTPAPTGSPIETPAGTRGLPEECSGEERGLISRLDFSNESGMYDPGEPVGIILTLVNCASNEAVLHFPTTQRYVFIAEDENGNTVWTSADGLTFEETEATEALEPGETIVYEESWDQLDRQEGQAPDGVYKISAFSVGCSDEARSDCKFGPVRFIGIGDIATPEPEATA